MKDFFMIQKKAMFDVVNERASQDAKFGGPAHDDKRPTYEFVELIQDYSSCARLMAGKGNNNKARRQLIQVAALAVAAVESIDRKKSREKS